MITLPHPSQIIKPNWLQLIREEAPVAENARSLTEKQLQLIYDQKWFKLFVPKEIGGLEEALPEAIALEEALAWADGSFGWTVTLCSGAGWFVGFLNSDFATEVFRSDKVCLGGSGAPTGKAEITENGYSISGRWKYATGSAHLTHFTSNCIVTKNNEPILDKSGEILILPFVFHKSQVSVIPDWNTIGLIATSSNAFEVQDLAVPVQRSFKIDAEAAKIDQPVYRYPFLQFAEATLAANISGMALHFIDCAKDVFSKRKENKKFTEPQEQVMIDAITAAKSKLGDARSDFYQAVNKSWKIHKTGGLENLQVLEEVSIASRNLASVARSQVDKLFPLCGLIAVDPCTEINRVWRDIHTASQHTLLNSPYS